MSQKVFLISTGLGKINRGFEIYIADLAGLLHENLKQSKIFVYCAGFYENSYENCKIVPCVFRDSRVAYFLYPKSSSKRLRFERFTFFWGLLPSLIFHRPDVLYLGEYALYCWLYKFRKITGLAYKLVLYTGGQAIPGKRLFDPSKDFIHHITNTYLEDCKHFPDSRQTLLPHFVADNFIVDDELLKQIQFQAVEKKIVLSIGAIEKSSKRMHWLVEALGLCNQPIFPILLGEPTADYHEILKMLQENFGNNGFILEKVSRAKLGTYYQVADLFVSCSPKESFGLVFVEALLFGLPIICDDFKEVRFVLQDQAYYISMKTPEAVTHAINDVLSEFSIETSVSVKASRRQFAIDKYSISSLLNEYIKLFERI